MRCPRCSSPEYERVAGRSGKPRTFQDTTLRVHRCLNCKFLFLSQQHALNEEQSADILDVLEGIQ